MRFKEVGRSKILQSTFISNAAKIWNAGPLSIKNCNSLYSEKKETKSFDITLPSKNIFYDFDCNIKIYFKVSVYTFTCTIYSIIALQKPKEGIINVNCLFVLTITPLYNGHII